MPSAWSLLITCEHASAALPEGAALGVSEDVLDSHVAFDRYAARVARALASLTGAPLHLGRYSRLWVDLNRREENPAAILSDSYGVRIAENLALTDAERAARLAAHHRPYRDAAAADARRLVEQGGCMHLSVHSFDASLDPPRRSFDAGVLFDPAREPEASEASALADRLGAAGLEVRLNEPYAGTPEGLTSHLRERFEASRYIGIEIEGSQRSLGAQPGAPERFAALLAAALPERRG